MSCILEKVETEIERTERAISEHTNSTRGTTPKVDLPRQALIAGDVSEVERSFRESLKMPKPKSKLSLPAKARLAVRQFTPMGIDMHRRGKGAPWRMDSTVGQGAWDTDHSWADDPQQLLARDEELVWLKKKLERRWRLTNGRISATGDPTNVEGTYGALLAYPPQANLTAVTGVTTALGYWTSSLFSPIPLNSVMAPEAYRIAASGLITSSSTAQTETLTPGMGATNVNAAPGSNVTLGASGALSLGASSAQTNMFWYFIGDITMRGGGAGGSVYGMFEYRVTNVAGTSTSVLQSIFGNTVATVDFTVTPTGGVSGQAFVLQGVGSATTVSRTTTQVHWMSWN